MKKMRAGPSLYLGVDGRRGVNRDQEASASPTFVAESRTGCHLNVPPRLMADGAGTLTREQYDHICVVCKGSGCINCRQTGFDQTPCINCDSEAETVSPTTSDDSSHGGHRTP